MSVSSRIGRGTAEQVHRDDGPGPRRARRRAFSGDRVHVSGMTSASTGVAPSSTALKAATQLYAGTMTSSPGPTPRRAGSGAQSTHSGADRGSRRSAFFRPEALERGHLRSLGKLQRRDDRGGRGGFGFAQPWARVGHDGALKGPPNQLGKACGGARRVGPLRMQQLQHA